MGKRFIIFGAGSIGTSLGLWLNLYAKAPVAFYARGNRKEQLKEAGIISENLGLSYPAMVLEDLSEISEADTVILCVKSYHLEDCFSQLNSLDVKPAEIILVQNGIEGFRYLQEKARNVFLAIAAYNCSIDDFGAVYCVDRGPLVLGPNHNGYTISKETKKVLDLALPVQYVSSTKRLEEAVWSKIVLNLSSSVTSLLDVKTIRDENFGSYKDWFLEIINEGIRILRKAGYKEYPFNNVPGWKVFDYLPLLPNPIGKTLLKKNLKKLNKSSMQQDLEAGRSTELESINGELVKLADEIGEPAPFNKELLDICRSYFKKRPYIQMTWESLKEKITLLK